MTGASRFIEQTVPSELDLSDPDQRLLLEQNVEQYRFAATFVRGKKILDIGCGAGFGTSLLRSEGEAVSVTAVDIDERMISIAVTKHAAEGVSFQQKSYADVGGNAVFDTVVSINTLKHLPDTRSFISHVRRILRPGGELIVSAYITPTMDFNPYHCSDFSGRTLRRYLRRAGFSVLCEFMQIKRFDPGKSMKLMRNKKAGEDLTKEPRSLIKYYLFHPFRAIRRIFSVLRDGFTVKNLVIRLS